MKIRDRLKIYFNGYKQGTYDVLYTLNHVYGKEFVKKFMKKSLKQLGIIFINKDIENKK